jgi:hypothetical protein
MMEQNLEQLKIHCGWVSVWGAKVLFFHLILMNLVSYNAGVKFRTAENTFRLGLSMGNRSVVFTIEFNEFGVL